MVSLCHLTWPSTYAQLAPSLCLASQAGLALVEMTDDSSTTPLRESGALTMKGEKVLASDLPSDFQREETIGPRQPRVFVVR